MVFTTLTYLSARRGYTITSVMMRRCALGSFTQQCPSPSFRPTSDGSVIFALEPLVIGGCKLGLVVVAPDDRKQRAVSSEQRHQVL